MKRLLGIWLVVVLLLTLFIPVGAALAKNNEAHRVTCGGTVDWITGIDTFNFTAQHTGESEYAAKGQFLGQARDSGYRIKGEIDYLAVEGNQAWMGCRVTQSNIDSIGIGFEFIQLVVDNGEGKKATAADQMSNKIPMLASEVNLMPDPSDFDLMLVDWTNGNVQIH